MAMAEKCKGCIRGMCPTDTLLASRSDLWYTSHGKPPGALCVKAAWPQSFCVKEAWQQSLRLQAPTIASSSNGSDYGGACMALQGWEGWMKRWRGRGQAKRTLRACAE